MKIQNSVFKTPQHHTQEKVMHATTRMNFKPLALLAAVVALGLVSAALSLADPPPHSHGGEDPPPPEPSVGYWVTFLGTLGGEGSDATAINNRGIVVGWADIPSGEQHAFRVAPDVDGNYGMLVDLNDLDVWVDHLGNGAVRRSGHSSCKFRQND